MTKDQLILLLKKYKENKAKLRLEIKEKEKLIEQLKDVGEIYLKSNTIKLNSNIKSKNSITDTVGNTVSNSIDKENNIYVQLESLEKEIIQLNDLIEEVDIRLEALQYREREILKAYYIDGCTYEDIGNRVYHQLFGQMRTARNIQDVVEKAIKKMLKI